jgi:hypothetical protein
MLPPDFSKWASSDNNITTVRVRGLPAQIVYEVEENLFKMFICVFAEYDPSQFPLIGCPQMLLARILNNNSY